MSYKVIDRVNLDLYLKELAKVIRKNDRKNRNSYEIIIVGGASILINYEFRRSTMDIDCIDVNNILMNDAISVIANKYDLPTDWINTDFMMTKSYSKKLIRYSVHYKTFGNGVLNVRTIKDEYLIAMKLVSGRKYKNDLSDIIGILNDNKNIDLSLINKAIVELYDSINVINKEAYELLLKYFADESTDEYKVIRQKEEDNQVLLINSMDKYNLDENNIDYILSKLKE